MDAQSACVESILGVWTRVRKVVSMARAGCQPRVAGKFNTSIFIDLYEKTDPRKAMDRALVRIAEEDPRVVVLTADVGTAVAEFKERFPDRFLDFGIAEQNMIGAAAGLALSGMVPFVTTMACFISMRGCEQVRTDVAYQVANVKLIGFGCGTTYGTQGTTHHSTEDIGIMRSFPNMVILSPAGAVETQKSLQAAVEHNGPVYIRVGRGPEPVVYGSDYDFEIGKAILLRQGKDVALVATGCMVAKALLAASELEKLGIAASVLNVHTLKPLDRTAIAEVARNTMGVVTVEDHNVIGGLGSAVSEVLAEENLGPLRRVGIPDVFCVVGSHEEILSTHRCGVADIVKAAQELMEVKYPS